MRGDADRLLAGRRIGHEQHLARLEKFLQPLDLLDQRLVDLLPARGVENLDVRPTWVSRPFERQPGRFLHILQPGRRAENRHADLLPERRQLLDGRRAVQDRTR